MPTACPWSPVYVYSEPSNLGLSRVEKPTPSVPSRKQPGETAQPRKGISSNGLAPEENTLKNFHRGQGTREVLQESRPRLLTRLSQELPPLPGQGAHKAAWQELTMAGDQWGVCTLLFPFPNGSFYFQHPILSLPGGEGDSG